MNKGYTLIEVVIALAIFAVLSVMSVGLISRAFDVRERLSQHHTPISELQLAITRIQLDLQQVVPRAVRDASAELHDAFEGSDQGFEFSRGGLLATQNTDNPSSIRRAAFACEEHALVRKSWKTLDGYHQEQAASEILLSDLDACEFSYLSRKKWASVVFQRRSTPFPGAVRLSITHKKLGKAKFIFLIPAGMSNETM